MVELVLVKKLLRAILFIALVIIYSVMYFEPALKIYDKKSTTISQKREYINQPEPPILVLCPDPPFKKSFFEQFGKKKIMGAHKFFWSLYNHWQMLENYNHTALDIYTNMSYQLGLDWNISLPTIEQYVLYVCYLQQNEVSNFHFGLKILSQFFLSISG